MITSIGSSRRQAAAAVNKQEVLDHIISVLKSELAALTKAAHESFSAATDPDSKAENKYDTRTLEASYVARGQAQRVVDLQGAVLAFEALSAVAMPDGAATSLGALIGLQGSDGLSHYFLGPAAGGLELTIDATEVIVITPASPLAKKLIGARLGSRLDLHPGVSVRVASIE